MRILITGGAGFIGSAICRKLLDRGDHVTSLDNLNDYYEVGLKLARLEQVKNHKNFKFHKLDIVDRSGLDSFFRHNRFDGIVHLAAQAGVRYSIDHPSVYIDSNLVGFANILEGCRHSEIAHLVYASSSSVYGGNTKLPFNENDPVDHPVSLYAATKKANELMAHSYAHLYQIPCTALRFFTVYGPWGRPDMAFFKFTRMMLNGEKIPVYNHGKLTRDFTFIDDIVEGVIRVLDVPATADGAFSSEDPAPAVSNAPHRIYNIGNGSRVNLMDYIHALENALGVKAEYNMLPMQPGDVEMTNADTSLLAEKFHYIPKTSIQDGLAKFAEWYRSYYS